MKPKRNLSEEEKQKLKEAEKKQNFEMSKLVGATFAFLGFIAIYRETGNAGLSIIVSVCFFLFFYGAGYLMSL